AAGFGGQAQFHQRDRVPDQPLAQPDDLGAEARVRSRRHDLHIDAASGQRQRYRQAMSDLVDLVMIEEEADAHTPSTSRPTAHLRASVAFWSVSAKLAPKGSGQDGQTLHTAEERQGAPGRRG